MTSTVEKPQPAAPSGHFPPQVRDSLIRAAQTPITDSDPLARILAIERAIERARAAHPELFSPDA